MFDIGIVGLGATGVSLLNNVQNQAYNFIGNKFRIAVFNPPRSFARGKAFGDADSLHKVNTPAWMMDISSAAPEKFRHWIKKKTGTNPTYPKRLTYSRYIKDTYRNIIKAGILNITEFTENVVDISINEQGLSIYTSGRAEVRAQKVVMCLGALQADSFADLSERSGFIYHYSQYDSYDKKEILIAGSGMSAVDAFRYAYKHDNKSIHMFSRSGYAPTCATQSHRYVPRHLNWQAVVSARKGSALSAFSDLLQREYAYMGKKNEYEPAMDLLKKGKQYEYFRYLSARAEQSDLPWQDLLVSTRAYMHRFWSAMTTKERKIFFSRWGTAWAAWRHPIIPKAFHQLKEASYNGRLRLHRTIRAPVYIDGSFSIYTSHQKKLEHSVYGTLREAFKI